MIIFYLLLEFAECRQEGLAAGEAGADEGVDGGGVSLGLSDAHGQAIHRRERRAGDDALAQLCSRGRAGEGCILVVGVGCERHMQAYAAAVEEIALGEGERAARVLDVAHGGIRGYLATTVEGDGHQGSIVAGGAIDDGVGRGGGCRASGCRGYRRGVVSGLAARQRQDCYN